MLRRASGGQTAPATPAGTKPLEATYWKAVELAGKPAPAQDPNREAHLVFQPAGRVSGSDGCNRVTGSHQRKGDAITFGQMAGTQMAWVNIGNIDRAFHDALKSGTRMKIAGDRLELFDAAGKRVAAFAAGTPASRGLTGTSWQLVKFQGSDDTTLTPDDGAKYTIEFGPGASTLVHG